MSTYISFHPIGLKGLLSSFSYTGRAVLILVQYSALSTRPHPFYICNSFELRHLYLFTIGFEPMSQHTRCRILTTIISEHNYVLEICEKTNTQSLYIGSELLDSNQWPSLTCVAILLRCFRRHSKLCRWAKLTYILFLNTILLSFTSSFFTSHVNNS